jgi:hypothetical protein
VGANALSLNYAMFAHQRVFSESEYLFIPAIFGTRKSGTGNGAVSVVDVVDVTGGITLAKILSRLFIAPPNVKNPGFSWFGGQPRWLTLLVLTCVYALTNSGANWRLSRDAPD